MAKPGNEDIQLLEDLRVEKASGKIIKRFQDDFFALDLLRILYDDTVEAPYKTELLIILEEYGHLGVTEESIDQLVTSLLDIFHQTVDQADNWLVVSQVLVTSTSLLIQLDQLTSSLCNSVVKELVTVVTTRVNQPDSHRLRSTACQCLIHLEEFSPGLLSSHYEDISKLAKQEKSYVFQDYVLLAAKVLSSLARLSDDQGTVLQQEGKLQRFQKQISYDPQDVRQIVAYFVENIPLCTRSGTYRLMNSLVSFIKNNTDISPMVFKPALLHQMCTMSCVVFHTVLLVQRQFEGEILNPQEEGDLLQRLCIMTDHPSLNPLHRLLASQWAHMYKLDSRGRPQVHESILKNHRLTFYPSVFDSVDLQLRKLFMTALCGNTSQDTQGVETSILLGSIACLHKLVWHTGSGLAARALFKALYFIYSYHNNKSFSKDIQRFVRGLISEFAHFIPHSLDFADSIHALNVDSDVYVDTLQLLHQQVVMATEEQIHSCYQFYLLIMKKAAAQKEINQMATLKFLTYLVENAVPICDSGWKLGHSILDILRNIILCHGTWDYFKELSSLLYGMMTSYGDTDVQDKATFYYVLITQATDTKVQSVLRTSLGDTEDMDKAITSLLQSTTEKLSVAKIIHLEEPVFDWERTVVSTSVQTKSNKSFLSTDDTGIDALQHYVETLKNLTVMLDVKCLLKLREESDFDTVHAVSIHVEPSEFFLPVQTKHVPCLKKTGSSDVTLHIKPKLPLPLTLCCRAEFCSDKKQTYSSVLTPVTLEFSHILMPLPWKPEKEADWDFTRLWNWVLSRNPEARGSIASVKMFQLGPEKFSQVHRNHLASFLFPNTDKCYAIFIAPENHILLRCQTQPGNNTVISIATDLWKLLPHIDKFLEFIMK